MPRRLVVLAAVTALFGGIGVPAYGEHPDDEVSCPPLSAIAPRYLAPSSIQDGVFDPDSPNSGNLPPEDGFLFHFSGGRVGQRHREAYGFRTIDALGNDFYLQGHEGVHYRVGDPFSGINLWFSVIPASEEIDRFGGKDDGLFLRRIEVPGARALRGDEPKVFSPATSETSGGLRIFHFPIQAGKVFEDTSVDVATKGSLPVGSPPIGTLSANRITSVVSVGGKDVFAVCDQLAQAWKVTMEIRSLGEYRWTLAGTFWLGTHVGGWPLKDEYTFISEDGKLVSGAFASNLARLDPGSTD